MVKYAPPWPSAARSFGRTVSAAPSDPFVGDSLALRREHGDRVYDRRLVRLGGTGPFGAVHAVKMTLAIHRERADAPGVRNGYGRYAVRVNPQDGIVVLLRHEHAPVLVRDDAVGAIAAGLPDFGPLDARGDDAGNRGDGQVARRLHGRNGSSRRGRGVWLAGFAALPEHMARTAPAPVRNEKSRPQKQRKIAKTVLFFSFVLNTQMRSFSVRASGCQRAVTFVVPTEERSASAIVASASSFSMYPALRFFSVTSLTLPT